MKNTDDNIEKLILKQLQQETSPAERAELQYWLDSDPANREEYEALMTTWEASLPVLQPHSFDTAAAWGKVGGNIRPTVEPVRLRHWLGAAAVLILLSSAGWWYYRQYARASTKSFAALDANRPISLPDGSRILLRKGSTISYAGSFPGRRMVELKGEAEFEVEHDPANPFMVRTSRAIVEELGTSFVVKEDGAAGKVIVTAGKVKYTDRILPTRSILLTAGESAILTGDGFSRNRQYGLNYLSWKTNTLEFNGTPLDEAVADIQDLYEIPLGLSPELRPEAGKIRITARFAPTQRVKDVLDEIKLMTGLSMQQEKDTLIFFRK